MKKIHLTTILSTINLLLFTPALLEAQTTGQEASIQFSTGEISIESPLSINFPPQFISPTPNKIISTHDPSIPAQTIAVTDARNNGDFSVDIRVENLVSENNDIIPHYNIGILTLAAAEAPQTIDIIPNTAPTDVSGPLDYDWDFDAPINSVHFQQIIDSGLDVSDPILIIDGINPGTNRIGKYSLSLGIEIEVPALHPSGNYEGEIIVTLNT